MRYLRLMILTLGASALSSSGANAQFFLAELGRGSGPSQLLLRPEVQKELKMTDDQIKRAEAVSMEIRGGLDEKFAEVAELDGRERDRKKMELGNEIKRRARAYVRTILSPEQHKRLDEIAVRAAGILALKDEQVETALNLTKEQKADIQKFMQDAITEMQVLFKSTPEEHEEAQKIVARYRKAAYDKALTLLTPDQRKKWDELRGEPFTFVIVEKSPIAKAPRKTIKLPPEAMPSEDKANLDWVAIRADKWQPQVEEKRFDDIGWAETDILGGLKAARQHGRPLFVFLVDGFSHRGRC
jgi:hypothetical protein